MPVLPLLLKGNIIETGVISYQNYGFITIDKNPLSIPVSILEKGHLDIKNYLLELEKQGEKIVNEVKLLIVGEGGVGKTTLARRIVGGVNAIMPEEQDTTKGINILKYSYKIPNRKGSFRLHIWDFGGQEIYHATHQFFLTKRSLYLLVDDTRRDDKTIHDTSFNYWLQVIQLLGGNSPLIIIQNEKGDRSKEIDLANMKSRFENIKERYKINLLSCRGLPKLLNAIKYHSQQLPHIGEALPKQWTLIRHELEELAVELDFITLSEYFEICARFKIPEHRRALHLSDYLHDLGIFLHFQNDILLRNIFILNTSWVTDAVYKLLDYEKVKMNFGLFDMNDLDRIWDDLKYNSKHAELIALMKKFELIYEIKETLTYGTRWLAPQLHPIESPEIEWDYRNNLTFKFVYDFMPKGLIPKFIVRMNRYIKNPHLSWRTGVILVRNDAEAWIKKTFGKAEIEIRIKGKELKEFMILILEDFEMIHSRYANLQLQKMIPCNCTYCKNMDTPNYYEYSDLENRKNKGKSTVECKYSVTI